MVHPGGLAGLAFEQDQLERRLGEAGLISSERRGTWVYYRVNPAMMARMSAVLLPQLGQA